MEAVSYYLSEEVVANDPKGIGALLLASAELAKIETVPTPTHQRHR